MKTEIQEIRLEKSLARLIGPQMIENIVNSGVCIEKNDVVKIKRANLKLADGGRYVVLAHSGEFTSSTNEARKLSASEEFAKETIAQAFYVKSLGQKLVGRFFIAVNKPQIKTKLFTDRDKAIRWLSLQLKNNK